MPLTLHLIAETLKIISQMFIQKFKNCTHDFSLPQGTQKKDEFSLDDLERKSRCEEKYSVKQ